MIDEKKTFNKFVIGTNKLNNMLFLQQSSSWKLGGHGGKNHKGKFNKHIYFFKASCKTCTYCGHQYYINLFGRIRKVVHEEKYRKMAKVKTLMTLEWPSKNFTLLYLDSGSSRHIMWDFTIF